MNANVYSQFLAHSYCQHWHSTSQFCFPLYGSHIHENIGKKYCIGGGGGVFIIPMLQPCLQFLMSKQCSWEMLRNISMGLEVKAHWASGCGYWSPSPKSSRASDKSLYDFRPAWGAYFLWIEIMMHVFSLSPFQVVRSWKSSWTTEGQSTMWWTKFIVICSPHLILDSILQFKKNNSWQCVWMEVRFSFKDNNSSDEASVKQPGFRMGPVLYRCI